MNARHWWSFYKNVSPGKHLFSVANKCERPCKRCVCIYCPYVRHLLHMTHYIHSRQQEISLHFLSFSLMRYYKVTWREIVGQLYFSVNRLYSIYLFLLKAMKAIFSLDGTRHHIVISQSVSKCSHYMYNIVEKYIMK